MDLWILPAQEQGHLWGYDYSSGDRVIDTMLPLGTRGLWEAGAILDEALDLSDMFDVPGLTPTVVDDYFATM
jgi:hypothetical protein